MMDLSSWTGGFLEGLLAFGAYLLAVLMGLRLAPRVEPALLAVGAAFLVCPAALAVAALCGVRLNLWTWLVAYWFGVTSFLMAFGAVYKSLSLRILSDLDRQPGRSDDYQRIFSRYLVEDSYRNRLDVIREKALVTLDGERYALAEPGERLARRVRRVQSWFGIHRSG